MIFIICDSPAVRMPSLDSPTKRMIQVIILIEDLDEW
jgi:hypothetical protein